MNIYKKARFTPLGRAELVRRVQVRVRRVRMNNLMRHHS